MKKATVVIPTYNESKNIKKLVEEIFAVTKTIPDWDINILIVDSESPDGTGNIIREMGKLNKRIHSLNTKKEGLGSAYVAGFSYAIEKLNAEVLFEMDADFSHDPKAIPLFLKKIDRGADFVVGTRYAHGGSIPKDWGLDRKFYSIVGNLIIRAGFMKVSISDWTTGYRAIRSWVVKDKLAGFKKYTGYVFQVAGLDNAIKKHAVIAEVPIHFTDRKYGVSKINSGQFMRDTLLYILKNSPFIRYVIVGGTGFIIDFVVLYLLYRRMGFDVAIAQPISAELAIISNFIGNNYWSFSHKRVEHNPIKMIRSFGKFNMVALGSLVIQTVLLKWYHIYYGDDFLLWFKMLVLAVIIIPYSYILYNRVIWKKK